MSNTVDATVGSQRASTRHRAKGADEEKLITRSNTVLNLAAPNHLREALLSRRIGLAAK